jgi:hypothetical protein
MAVIQEAPKNKPLFGVKYTTKITYTIGLTA